MKPAPDFDLLEACIMDRCFSPMACGAFGYCRERHFLPDTDPRWRSVPKIAEDHK